jgi:hypothetical protein
MTETKPKLRWLQFSLRTFMVVIAVIAAWMAFYYLPATRSDRATKALERIGAEVRYDYERVADGYRSQTPKPGLAFLHAILGDGLFQHAETVSLARHNLKAEELAPLESIPTVQELGIYESQLKDEHLVHLAGLRRLKWLVLDGGQITDQGLATLANLTDLQSLQIADNQIHGSGLKHLADLTHLENLFLISNPIIDDSLVNIAALKNLKMLSLAGTEVTDEGLRHLVDLKTLNYLDVQNTKVTRAGAVKLKADLPNCVIDPFFPQNKTQKSGSSNPFE